MIELLRYLFIGLKWFIMVFLGIGVIEGIIDRKSYAIIFIFFIFLFYWIFNVIIKKLEKKINKQRAKISLEATKIMEEYKKVYPFLRNWDYKIYYEEEWFTIKHSEQEFCFSMRYEAVNDKDCFFLIKPEITDYEIQNMLEKNGLKVVKKESSKDRLYFSFSLSSYDITKIEANFEQLEVLKNENIVFKEKAYIKSQERPSGVVSAFKTTDADFKAKEGKSFNYSYTIYYGTNSSFTVFTKRERVDEMESLPEIKLLRKYQKALYENTHKECFYCKTIIDINALVCPQCSRDIEKNIDESNDISQKNNTLDELTKLVQLKDSGAITENEFTKLKKNLID